MTVSDLMDTAGETPSATDNRPARDNVRLCVFQPRVPHYREPFFALLARRCASLTIIHGAADAQEGFCEQRVENGYARRIVAHRSVGPLLWMPALVSGLDAAAYDVVVFSWNARYAHLWPGLRRARRLGMGTVVWGHGFSKNERTWVRRLRNRVAASADAIVTYGTTAADRLRKEGFEAERLFVAPNAIDQQRIQAARAAWLDDPARLADFRARHGFTGRPLALYVSRLVHPQDLEALLAAWVQVSSALPAARLLVVGDGPGRAAIEARARELRVAESVTFFGAVYDEDELAPLFLSARLMAMPRRVGLSLHHAFGYGLPLVTFDNPMIHGPEFDLLESNVNGLAVEPDNVPALAGALGRLLSDADWAERLGRAARERVLHDATLENMVDGFMAGVLHAKHGVRQRGR